MSNEGEGGRWKQELKAVIDRLGPGRIGGIGTPEAICEAAWADSEHNQVEDEFKKLGNVQADGPKQRWLVLKTVQWLVVNGWITNLTDAGRLFDAGLKNPVTGGYYAKSGRRLGEVPAEWTQYANGYPNAVEMEKDLVAHLGGWPKVKSEFTYPANAVLALTRVLGQVTKRAKGSADDPFDLPFVVFIAEAPDAGKSVLVRAWCAQAKEATDFAIHVPKFSDGTSGLVRLDFGNAPTPPDIVKEMFSDVAHRLGGTAGDSATEAASLLLRALTGSSGLKKTKKRDSSDPWQVIVLDNLASPLAIEALRSAARANSDFAMVLVVVTCRPDLVTTLSPSEPHRFHIDKWHALDGLRILAFELPDWTPDDEITLASISKALRNWPGALTRANRLLRNGDARELPDRITRLHEYLEQQQADQQARDKEWPARLYSILDGFSRPTPADLWATFTQNRRRWLQDEVHREGEPGFDLDAHFVSLRVGNPAYGANRPKASSLADALREAEAQDVTSRQRPRRLFVLNGAPGAGKSTLFRRLEWDMVNGRLASADGRSPLVLFVPLNTVDPPGADPWLWLHHTWWPQHQSGLPSLKEVMAIRPVWLLLDAANELKRPAGETVDQRVRAWVQQAQHLIPDNPAHRVIFSCSKGYAEQVFLDAKAVEIGANALDDMQINEYLERYLTSADPQAVVAELRRARALDGRPDNIFRLPLWLRLLSDDVNSRGRGGLNQLPRNKAGLLSSLLRRRLVAERRKETGPLTANPSLVTQGQWRQIDTEGHHFLTPYGSKLVPGLEKIATYMMKEGGTIRARAAAVAIGPDAPAVLGCAQKALDLVRCADADLGEPVDDDDDPNRGPSLAFTHHQFQEYFAGRSIARIGRIDPELVRPTFGKSGHWDEAVLFAAALASDEKLAAFIDAIRSANLPLAARCAGQVGVRERLTNEQLSALRVALQQRLTPEGDVSRAERIDCAEALFHVVHPDYEERYANTLGKDGKQSEDRFVFPASHARILIRSDYYPMGAIDLTHNEELPHTYHIAKDFYIAKYPVTNFEYACFIEAGGYRDSRWWDEDSESGRRRQNGANEKIVMQLMRDAVWVKGLPEADYNERLRFYSSQPSWRRWYQKRRTMTLERLRNDFESDYPPSGNDPWPAFWLDSRFNDPGKPVVGVDFYEARAYIRWLNATCASAGIELRADLPDEHQWEATCGGKDGWKWAADAEVFDPTRYNSAKTATDVSQADETTSVGAFPRGATPAGVHDMTGNVWEWTLSKYVPGRGEMPIIGDFPRVVRGGSWYDNQDTCRAACREWFNPVIRYDNLGFRLLFDFDRDPASNR